MEVLITIDDVRLEHYSPSAKNELKKQLTDIASNLAEEANRIEMGRRLPTSNAEVTQSDVVSASVLSRIHQHNRKNKWQCLYQLLATFSGIIVGWIFDEDKFKTESWRLYVFMLFLIVLVVSIVLTLNHNGDK